MTDVLVQLEYVIGCPGMAEGKEVCEKFITWLKNQPGRLVDLYDYDPLAYPDETRSLKLPAIKANPYLWYLKENE